MAITTMKFSDFPDAFPYFKEEEIPAKEAQAEALLKQAGNLLARKKMQVLNRKVRQSRTYYDLVAMSERGIKPTQNNLDRLRRGYMALNTKVYREKPDEQQRGFFEDKDSRWFGMTRPTARSIVLDELFPLGDRSSAEVPKPEDLAVVAQEGLPSWVAPTVGITLALGVAYVIHSRTK